MMRITINTRAHFWYVRSAGLVYSSARNVYVGQADADYQKFLDAGGFTTSIENEAELWDVISQREPGYLPAWLFDGVSFVQSGAGIYSKSQLTAYAAALRWAKENGGTIVAGVPVATDDRAKQMIMGARLAASDNASFSTPWIGDDGGVYVLDAQAVIAVSNGILAHVAGVFATFATVKAGIDAGSITMPDQVAVAFS